ncbi:MAG: hypothetical protein ACRCYO_03060 [Bacteroidia bacterium]
MKKLILLFGTMCFYVLAFAQTEKDTLTFREKLKSKPWTENDTFPNTPRHELYFNLAYPIRIMLGSDGYGYNRMSLTYKYARKKNSAWRAGFLVNTISNPIFRFNDEVELYENDSLREVNIFFTQNHRFFQLNLGHEWRSERKRMTYFAGFDIFGAYGKINYSMMNLLYTNQPPDSLSPSDWYLKEITNVYPSLEGQRIYAGMHFFAGMRYAFSKRWMVSLQVGQDIMAVWAIEYERSGPQSLTGKKRNTFDSNTPGIINDFSIGYRF